MKTMITLLMLSLVSFHSYADDLIRFSRIDQNIDHARANCLDRHHASKAEQSQQVKSYRAVITPKFFEKLFRMYFLLLMERTLKPKILKF